MARKTNQAVVVDDGAVPIVEGTVEWEAREHFLREKAGYEERTGETVNYVPPHPVTSTPLPVETIETVEKTSEDAAGSDEITPPAEGVGEN